MMRKILILIFQIFISNYLFAQSNNDESKNIPNIIPPSPTVNSLMKFEEIPVSNYTGIPDVKIPISNLSTGLNNVTFDMSLKYHVNNAKSESKASEVGLGWSLFAGGTISRTVMGSPDEKVVSYSIGGSNPKIGIYLDQNTDVNAYKNYFNSIIENPNTATNTKKSIYEAHYKNRYDTQYDLYQYNFLNYSGRFIVKKVGTQLQLVKLDKNNLKIKVNSTLSFEPISFDIVDEFGNIFVFDIVESSTTSSLTDILGLDMYTSTSASTMNTTYNSAFHLSKIKNSSNQLKVLLSYDPAVSILSTEKVTNNNHINYITGSYTYNIIQENKALLPKISEVSGFTTITDTRRIKEINLIDKGKVIFGYEDGREDTNYVGGLNATKLSKLKSINIISNDNKYDEQYILNYNYKQAGTYKRLFLSSVQKANKRNGTYIPDYKYQLQYHIPQLIPQLVSGEDTFYKCHGERSYGCSDIELLKSITYPTGGKSEFIYETGTFTYVPEETSGISTGAVELPNYDENELNWDPASSLTAFTNFDGTKKYAFTLSEATPITFIINTSEINQYPWHLSIFKKEGNNYITVGGTGLAYSQNNIPPNEYKISLQAGEYYLSLTKASLGTHTPFNASFYAYYKKRNNNNYKFLHDYRTNRIKSINYYEHHGSIPNRTIDFYYNNLTDSKKSSGALVFPRPVYSHTEAYSAGMEYTCHHFPEWPCTSVFISDITYNSTRNFLPVQKTRGADIGYQYVAIKETGRGKTIFQYTSPVDKPNLYTASTVLPFREVANYDYMRGNILNKKIFDENNNLIREDKFSYNYSGFDIITGATIIPLQINNIGYYLHGSKFITYEEFVLSNAGLRRLIGSDPFAFLNLSFRTEHIGTASLTEEQSITYYPDNKSLIVTKNTDYNPRDYPLKQTVTSSDSKITETNYQYAHEKNNTRLINANMIAIPLETSVVEKESPSSVATLISKSETRYDDASHLFPSSAISYNLHSGNASTQVMFDQYDSKGNILQYTAKDGVPTSIIWGYNGTQPIAKIEGALYNNIKNNPLIIAIINASNSDAANPATENNLITALDALRNDINFKNFQMATYTYDLLIGVTSITPPSGIREIYKYDTANRLEKIVDEEGKILKEYQYNYKP